MKHLILTILASLFVFNAQAKVEVLFHPHDPTLEQIAQWILEADRSIDIAMYNMETGDASPVIQALKSKAVQERLQAGKLQIRLIFEGYGTPEDNTKKMGSLEALGLDVRYLGLMVKVHHKFAVIDSGRKIQRVVTGSANWSLSSYRNYNENILFFENEGEISSRYQQEFNRLWLNAKEFGEQTATKEILVPAFTEQDNVEIFFNSPRTIDRDSQEPSLLTDQVVRLINEAQTEIKVASTRIRLQPILEALLAAAQRGVNIQVVLSQDDFMDIGRRTQYLMGHKNIEVRVKFYNLKVADYMTYQMHNKFMIVDSQTVWSGSFNWSNSSENKHIENVVEMTGDTALEVLPSYEEEFQMLWELGRENLAQTLQKIEADAPTTCSFSPMSLKINEARKLTQLGKTCNQP